MSTVQVTLPGRDEMLRRLTEARNVPFLIEGVYPALLQHAGQTMGCATLYIRVREAIDAAAQQEGISPGTLAIVHLKHTTALAMCLTDDPAARRELSSR